MKIGYVRSKNMDNIEEQVKSLSNYGVEKMFVDRDEIIPYDKSEFAKMMDFIKSGDIVIVDEIEVLGNDSNVVIAALKTMKSKNIEMKSIGEGFNSLSEILKYIEEGIGKYLIDYLLYS
nr:recombinase family protein [Sedimentibacter sp.]